MAVLQSVAQPLRLLVQNSLAHSCRRAQLSTSLRRAGSGPTAFTIFGEEEEPSEKPHRGRRSRRAQKDGGADDSRQTKFSPWRMGDPPESLEGRPGVRFLSDILDRRLTLYHQRKYQDRAECRKQELALVEQALAADPLAERDCRVGLHYSWECLTRLGKAREAGKKVTLHSVLLPSLAPEELLSTATGLTSEVYAVDQQAFRSHFQSKATGLAAVACSFAVAFPVSKPLTALRPPLLVLDGLDSPKNVGQILRTAVHLGVMSVVATQPAWESLNGKAVRSSMGWLYHMDCHHAGPTLEGTLEELRTLGIRTYVMENGLQEPIRPHEPAGDRRWALLVGREDTGVSKASRQQCDVRVCVPRRGGDSLNVAQASAICLYELGRHMDS